MTLDTRKTKIVATLGPSSGSREVIHQMLQAGVDVVRLNFSHGSHESHSETLQLVREESEKIGRHVAVFQDLCGPKLRINELEGGEITLEDGSEVLLRYAGSKDSKDPGNSEEILISIFNPGTTMQVGERALLADGRIELIAQQVSSNSVRCKVRAGGIVRSRSGIAVPESKLRLPCLTEKDKKDLVWAVENKLDYVALSFVGTRQDVLDLRQEMDLLGRRIPIISKIERASSLDEIDDIVGSSDAIMVARGDLGLELPIERVPSAQRLIISASNFAGVPVITATQMLMSMVKEIRPTRAEVTDVTTAVRDGTDAVMLSDETAIGQYPVESVKVLSRICLEAEKEANLENSRVGLKSRDRSKVADAVCYAASSAADKVSAAAAIACTQSGSTARLMAKYRPKPVLLGATSQKETLARMALYWGVRPMLVETDDELDTEAEIVQALQACRDNFGIKPGSRVVITAGLRTGMSGSTNVMEIREVPRKS